LEQSSFIERFEHDNQADKKTIQFFLKETYKKCVYCEATGNLDIEHYRPKRNVRNFDGAKTTAVINSKGAKHNGYYWLKDELTNMLWVCHDCNAGEGGKHTKFPVKGTRIVEPQTDKKEWRVNSQTFINENALLSTYTKINDTFDFYKPQIIRRKQR